MPRVEVERFVAAPIQDVYAACRDIRGLAERMPDVRSFEILEQGPDHQISSWDTLLQGRSFRWQERDEFDDEQRRIRYEQTKGDLKVMRGEWRFEPADENGAAGTRIRLYCEFEFGIPMLAAVLNPIASIALRRNLEAMLQAVSERLEPA